MEDIVAVMEGRAYGGRAVAPLSENHWSNLLAHILGPHSHKPTADLLLKVLLTLADIPQNDEVVLIQRERHLQVTGVARFVDLVISFSTGVEVFIENKIDRTYEDIEQLRDELTALRPEDHLILLCPRGLTLLQRQTRELIMSDPRLHHVRWLELAQGVSSKLGQVKDRGLDYYLLQGFADYWLAREEEDFLWQVETIVEENKWECFYPDEFEEAFRSRFSHVYDRWVKERGDKGNGNAHQVLTQKLVGLVRMGKGRLRLKKTQRFRPPCLPNWGYDVVYEYRVCCD